MIRLFFRDASAGRRLAVRLTLVKVLDITDEQRSRRPIFNATLRAAARWLFFRVARSTHMTQSGFELFFSKSAAVFAAAGEGSMPDLARLLAISEEHQIEFVPPLAVPQQQFLFLTGEKISKRDRL